MKAALGAGLGLAAAVAGVTWWLADLRAAAAAGAFGLLATGVHLAALALLVPVLDGPFPRVMARIAMGMGLRLAGAGIWVGAVLLDRATFPALPTAAGYVAVLVPLLFLETRLLAT